MNKTSFKFCLLFLTISFTLLENGFSQNQTLPAPRAINGYYYRNIIPYNSTFQVGFGATIPALINNDTIIDFFTAKIKYPQVNNSPNPYGNEISTLEVYINDGNYNFQNQTSKYLRDTIFILRQDGISATDDLNNDGINDWVFTGEHFHNNPVSKYFEIGLRQGIDVDTSMDRNQRRPNILLSSKNKLIDTIGYLDTLLLKTYHSTLIFDWDNDGKKDLVLSEHGAGKTFQFWKNQGNKMTLSYPISETQDGIGVSEGPFNIKAHDINNDNFKDFIFCGALGDIYICFNKNGAFHDSSVIKIFDYTNLPKEINSLRGSSLEVKDLNNDGNVEIIALFSPGSGTHDAIDRNQVKSIYKIISYINSSFVDVTQKYFPTNLNVNNFYSNRDFKLIDLDQDGFIDLYPITGDNGCTTKFPQGCGYFGYRGIDSTVYFKNIDGKNFELKSLGLFFRDTTSQNIYHEFKKIGTNINGYNLALGNQIVPFFWPGYTKPIFMTGIQKGAVSTYESKIIVDSFPSLANRQNKNFILNNNSTLGFLLLPCEIPKPKFNTTNFKFCSGDSLELTISNVNKGDTLKWYYGTKSDITNVANKTFTDSTKLYVTRTDSIGCVVSSDTIQLSKTSRPTSPSLSRDADNNLVANINGITWYKDGVKIADSTQKIKPTSNGNYTATTTQNGCTSGASANYYYLTSAVANLSTDEFFKISPNPTNGEIYLNYNIRSTKDVYINVIDMSGRIIITNRKVNSGSKLNLGSSMKGNYIIQVKDKSGRLLTTEKLIKN